MNRSGKFYTYSMEKERAWRIVILLTLSVLLMISMLPLLGHHVVGSMTPTNGHLISLCLVALNTLFAPIHGAFHLAFITGVVYALADRVRAWHLAHTTVEVLDWDPPVPGDRFWTAADQAAVDPARIRVTFALPTVAFTIGWWTPVIYVGRENASGLSTEQLAAVIEHEAAHLKRRDPLRLALLRFLTCMLYWLPIVRGLASDLAEDLEFLADDAVRKPAVLASAILATARSSVTAGAPQGTAGFHRADLVDRRVRRLVGERAPMRSHVTSRSVAGAITTLVLLVSSGIVASFPAQDAITTGVEHCANHETPWGHLFCTFDRAYPGHEGCPHLFVTNHTPSPADR